MTSLQSCLLFVFGVLCIAVSLICVKPKVRITSHFDASTLKLPDGTPVSKWQAGQVCEVAVYDRLLTWPDRYDGAEYMFKKWEIHRPWSFRRAFDYCRRHLFYPAHPAIDPAIPHPMTPRKPNALAHDRPMQKEARDAA